MTRYLSQLEPDYTHAEPQSRHPRFGPGATASESIHQLLAHAPGPAVRFLSVQRTQLLHLVFRFLTVSIP